MESEALASFAKRMRQTIVYVKGDNYYPIIVSIADLKIMLSCVDLVIKLDKDLPKLIKLAEKIK